MFKLAKWLWRKSEKQTADHIIEMAHAYFVQPIVPSSSAGDRDKAVYARQNAAWRDGMRFVEMIQDKYFPEIKENEIRRETELYSDLKKLPEVDSED